ALREYVKRPWTVKKETDRRGFIIDWSSSVARWLKANEKPLALVVEASKRSNYYEPLVPRLGSSGLISANRPRHKRFIQALIARAMLHAGEGRNDEAWQDLLAGWRLVRLESGGGLHDSALVLLDHGKMTTRQLKDCLRDLQNLPPRPTLADRVDVTQRLVFL